MSRASEAYERLSLVMLDTTPACLGLELFTASDLDKADVAACAALCDVCPLFDLCRAYADLEKPKVGVWAGRTYRTNNTKREAND